MYRSITQSLTLQLSWNQARLTFSPSTGGSQLHLGMYFYQRLTVQRFFVLTLSTRISQWALLPHHSPPTWGSSKDVQVAVDPLKTQKFLRRLYLRNIVDINKINFEITHSLLEKHSSTYLYDGPAPPKPGIPVKLARFLLTYGLVAASTKSVIHSCDADSSASYVLISF